MWNRGLGCAGRAAGGADTSEPAGCAESGKSREPPLDCGRRPGRSRTIRTQMFGRGYRSASLQGVDWLVDVPTRGRTGIVEPLSGRPTDTSRLFPAHGQSAPATCDRGDPTLPRPRRTLWSPCRTQVGVGRLVDSNRRRTIPPWSTVHRLHARSIDQSSSRDRHQRWRATHHRANGTASEVRMRCPLPSRSAAFEGGVFAAESSVWWMPSRIGPFGGQLGESSGQLACPERWHGSTVRGLFGVTAWRWARSERQILPGLRGAGVRGTTSLVRGGWEMPCPGRCRCRILGRCE